MRATLINSVITKDVKVRELVGKKGSSRAGRNGERLMGADCDQNT